MLVVKLKNDDKKGMTTGISIELPDGRNLLDIVPIRAIRVSHSAMEMAELEVELDPIGVKYDLLCTLNVEDIVRQVRDLEQEKIKNPHGD